MRELKFRAWDKLQKKMTYSDDFNPYGKLQYFFEENETLLYAVIMEFTGLKDKNGKEIYERDILKIKYDRQDAFTNSFDLIHKNTEDVGNVELNMGSYCVNKIAFAHYVRRESVEVIGNIYENKELLDEKKV